VTCDRGETRVKLTRAMVKHQFFPRMGVFLSGASLPKGISGTRRSGFGHRRHDFWFLAFRLVVHDRSS
jgi:hypothetical protein